MRTEQCESTENWAMHAVREHHKRVNGQLETGLSLPRSSAKVSGGA
jgi:hypothetical protein